MIVRNEGASRFELVIDDDVAELDYHRHGDRLTLLHTEVPDAFEGQGVGGQLVRAALEYAEAEGLTIVPSCPFARSWLERHPDEAARVSVAG
jgi:predicted GNAT family acetyltransferase